MHVRDFLNIFWYSVWERDVGRFAGEKKRGPGETLEEEEEKVLTRNLLSHKRRRKEEKTEDVSSEKKPRAGAAKIGGGGRRKCLSDFRQNNSRSRRENTSLLHLSYTLFFRDAAASSIFFLRFFLSAWARHFKGGGGGASFPHFLHFPFLCAFQNTGNCLLKGIALLPRPPPKFKREKRGGGGHGGGGTVSPPLKHSAVLYTHSCLPEKGKWRIIQIMRRRQKDGNSGESLRRQKEGMTSIGGGLAMMTVPFSHDYCVNSLSSSFLRGR